MRFRKLLSLPVLFLIAMAAVSVCKAEEATPAPPSNASPAPASENPATQETNAAVIYRQAFAAMPELTEEEKKLLATKPGEPIDEAAAKNLLAKYAKSFQLIEQAASMPKCDWGVDLTKGPEVELPHIFKAMALAKALRLQSAIRLEIGDTSGAVADLLTILRMSRTVAEPPLIISYMIQNITDKMAIDQTARMLPKFDAASLQTLSDGIAALPPAHTIRETIPFEKCMVQWMRNQAKEAIAQNDSKNWVKRLKTVLSMQTEPAKDQKPTLPVSPNVYLRWVEGADQAYDKLEKIMALPYGQFLPQATALEKKADEEKASNLIGSNIVKVVAPVRINEAITEAKWAMLKAAIDAQLHHPNEIRTELAKARDPFGDGPFECREVPEGVELQSKLIDNHSKPVTLTIGLAGR